MKKFLRKKLIIKFHYIINFVVNLLLEEYNNIGVNDKEEINNNKLDIEGFEVMVKIIKLIV